MKYMSLLIRQDRPNAQKYILLYFISGNQLFKLTAHDMKSALVNEKLENHGSQKYSSKRVKVVNPKPTDTPSKVPSAIQTSGNNPNDTPITVPTIIQTSVIKNGVKPDEPPQNVAPSHLKDPISTTTNLDEACPLDTSCNLQPHLDSPSLSSELQDNSSVDSVGVHSPSASQASHTNLSNSLVSKYPPDPGEHVVKRYATSTCEQDIPVQWFKFIHPSPKTRMTKTPFQITVHVAYSPIASMPSSSSETNRVSNSHSSIVTTPSSRIILGKPKVEVTKALTHHNGKNGEHFYGENLHNTTKNGIIPTETPT